MAKLFGSKGLGKVSTMTAAAAGAAGTGGTAPAPSAGDQNRALTGGAVYAPLPMPHDQAKAYKAGDRVIAAGALAEAIGDCPANTAFAWGSAGATWKPVTYRQWRGLYAKNTSYAVGDMFILGSTLASMPLVVETAFTSSNVSGDTDAQAFWRDLYTAGGAGVGKASAAPWCASLTSYREYGMVGATLTNAGAAGVLPAPPAASHDQALLGNGAWSDIGQATLDRIGGGTLTPLGYGKVIGGYRGEFTRTATLATFANAAAYSWWIYADTVPLTLGGYTFRKGDILDYAGSTAYSGTPTTLTLNFGYISACNFTGFDRKKMDLVGQCYKVYGSATSFSRYRQVP